MCLVRQHGLSVAKEVVVYMFDSEQTTVFSKMVLLLAPHRMAAIIFLPKVLLGVLLLTETITEATTDTNLTLVENHYPPPQSGAVTSAPSPPQAGRPIPIPSAPPLTDGPALSSLPELSQVGWFSWPQYRFCPYLDTAMIQYAI